jgi:hypothetical protein
MLWTWSNRKPASNKNIVSRMNDQESSLPVMVIRKGKKKKEGNLWWKGR